MDEAEETATAARSAPQIEGAVNFRDLGGYSTSDGRTVRPGLVYRSGMLGRLTDAGVDELAGLGLRLVLDFRTTAEANAWPDRLPDPAPRLLAQPVGDGDEATATMLGLVASHDLAGVEEALADGRGEQLMIGSARALATDPIAMAAWATAFRELSDPDSLPALMHCTGGKDRTGIASAVLLLALGVPRETVFEDYLLSNLHTTRLATLAAGLGLDPELLRPVTEVRRTYLGAALEEIDRRHGSMEGYIRDGLDDHTLDRLRHNLLA